MAESTVKVQRGAGGHIQGIQSTSDSATTSDVEAQTGALLAALEELKASGGTGDKRTAEALERAAATLQKFTGTAQEQADVRRALEGINDTLARLTPAEPATEHIPVPKDIYEVAFAEDGSWNPPPERPAPAPDEPLWEGHVDVRELARAIFELGGNCGAMIYYRGLPSSVWARADWDAETDIHKITIGMRAGGVTVSEATSLIVHELVHGAATRERMGPDRFARANAQPGLAALIEHVALHGEALHRGRWNIAVSAAHAGEAKIIKAMP